MQAAKTEKEENLELQESETDEVSCFFGPYLRKLFKMISTLKWKFSKFFFLSKLQFQIKLTKFSEKFHSQMHDEYISCLKGFGITKVGQFIPSSYFIGTEML